MAWPFHDPLCRHISMFQNYSNINTKNKVFRRWKCAACWRSNRQTDVQHVCILPTPDLATHAAKLERSLPFSHFSSLCVFSYLNSDLCLPSTVSLNMSGVFSYKCGSRYICPTSIHSTWHVNKHPTALGRWPAAVNTGLEAATKITALNHAGRRLCTDYTQKIPP